MRKNAFVLILLTIFSKLLGFGREVVLAYYYGTTHISDAYLIALTIPGTIFAFVGAGIHSSYIPTYNHIEHHENSQSADQFTTNLIQVILLIAAALILLVLMLAPQLVNIFASGFHGETLMLTVKLTRISIFGILFSGMTYVLSGYLNIKKDFFTPALMGIPFNFFVMFSIIISQIYHVIWLGYGIVLAMFFQWLLLIPSIKKNRFKCNFKKFYKNPHLKRMLTLALPVIIGSSINQINILVDRTLASRLASGGIASLNYANRLNDFVIGIFVVTFITVIYPTISKLAIKKNLDELEKLLSQTITDINLLLFPIVAGTMIFSEPFVKILFGRGAFGEEAIIMTSDSLLFYAIGMIGIGYREILTKVFYALEDTRTPMTNAGVSFLLNILLNIILSNIMGIKGLALATSISALFCSALLGLKLRKKIVLSNTKKVLTTSIKILISTFGMSIFSKLVYSALILNLNLYIALFITIVSAALVYIFLLMLLKVDAINDIKNIVRRKQNATLK